MQANESASVSAASPPLTRLIHAAIDRNGGWLPFDRFMATALYAPGLGYYASPGAKFGTLPQTGSDFVTPRSPLFGRASHAARAGAQASGSDEAREFGAGSGALAAAAEATRGAARYTIVDLSGTLRGSASASRRSATSALGRRCPMRWA